MLLKRPENLFNQVISKERLPYLALVIWILIGTLAFGASVGAFSGGIMYLYAAVKIFLVMASTTLICLPSMFLFTLVFGIDFSIKQIAKLVFTNMYLLSILLFSLVPVIWFVQNFYHDYRFNVMILVLTYSMAWMLTIYTTWSNLKTHLSGGALFKMLAVWCIVSAFVSTQMIWIYRPWVGYTYVEENLPFIRPLEGDIYNSVIVTFRTWVERNL